MSSGTPSSLLLLFLLRLLWGLDSILDGIGWDLMMVRGRRNVNGKTL